MLGGGGRVLTQSSDFKHAFQEEEEITLDDATRAHAESTKKKQMAALQFAEDPYELLGLGHLRWRATDDDIRKACMFLPHYSLDMNVIQQNFNAACSQL